MVAFFVQRYGRWFALWVVMLMVSLALTTVAAQAESLPGDTAVLQWVQDQPFPGLDLSKLVRAITSTEIVLATGAVVSVGLWVMKRRQEALLLAVGIIVLPLLQHGIKEIVDRPRPGPDVAELRSDYSSASFPAGHVMSATLLYGFLLYLSWKRDFAMTLRLALGAFSVMLLVLNGIANIYVGVHWPSDVVGGYLWGLVLLLPLIAFDLALPGVFSQVPVILKLRSPR